MFVSLCPTNSHNTLASIASYILALATVITCALSPLANAQSKGKGAQLAEQYGISLDYKLAWFNTQSKQFGATLTPKFLGPKSRPATDWLLTLTYPTGSILSLNSSTTDWKLQSNSWSWQYTTMPTKKLPGPFYIVATASSSQVLSATTISTVGVPTQLVIYPRRKAADSLTKLTLKPRVGFTVNNGVSVSKLPSNPPANWGKVTAPSRGYKYVKGDPNYDYELNPLATKLSGPLTGLLAYLTVLGIAVLFYIMGTILRIRYLVMYRRLKKQMQPVTGIIVNGQVVSGIHVANAAIAAKLP